MIINLAVCLHFANCKFANFSENCEIRENLKLNYG